MIFRIYHETLGGHVHMRVFAGKAEGALGKCGDLTMRVEEFEDFRNCSLIDFRPEDNGQVGATLVQYQAGIAVERERCLALVLAARMGDIDGSDLRSLRHFIKSGQTVEQIKAY